MHPSVRNTGSSSLMGVKPKVERHACTRCTWDSTYSCQRYSMSWLQAISNLCLGSTLGEYAHVGAAWSAGWLEIRPAICWKHLDTVCAPSRSSARADLLQATTTHSKSTSCVCGRQIDLKDYCVSAQASETRCEVASCMERPWEVS